MNRKPLISAAEIMGQVAFRADIDRQDLIDPQQTRDNLFSLFLILIIQGHFFEVTSVRRDHLSDLLLGQHGHSNGFAFDFVPETGSEADVLHDLVYKNPLCTTVCLGGEYRTLMAEGIYNGTVVCHDNNQTHIHVQSA